jgi:hypothetical protein
MYGQAWHHSAVNMRKGGGHIYNKKNMERCFCKSSNATSQHQLDLCTSLQPHGKLGLAVGRASPASSPPE